MVLTMGDGPDVGVGTITWFIIILIIIFILLIILILVCLLKRNRGGKYPVQKKVSLFRAFQRMRNICYASSKNTRCGRTKNYRDSALLLLLPLV